jgi:hypothetical protein
MIVLPVLYKQTILGIAKTGIFLGRFPYIEIRIIKEFSCNFFLGLDLKPADEDRHVGVYKVKNGNPDSRIMIQFCGHNIRVLYIILDAVPVVIVCPEKLFSCMDTGDGFFDVLSMVSAGIKKA